MTYSKRFERKYIINFDSYKKILKDIQPYFNADKHGNKNGEYIVSSLYYDSEDFRAYREKINGEKKRSKLRLRTYIDLNGKDLLTNGKVLLEIKKRDNLDVFKKKIMLNEKEAKQFIEKPIFNKKLFDKLDESEKQALIEAAYLKTLYNIRPAVIVTYIRQAFVNKFGPQIRITFDKNVKYRSSDFSVNNPVCREYILDPRLIVLEIKYNEILPKWISDIIGKNSLNLNTFGKYCKAIDSLMTKREGFINKELIQKNFIVR